MNLKWAKLPKANGYIIQRAMVDKKSKTKFKTIKVIKGNSRNYTDKSVKKDVTYTYKVRAYKIKKIKTKSGKTKRVTRCYNNSTPSECYVPKSESAVARDNRKYINEDSINNKSSIWKYVVADNTRINSASINGIDYEGKKVKDYYSPIKYKFTGNILEIHVYTSFVQQRANGSIIKADDIIKTDRYGNKNNYKQLCIDSFFKFFNNKELKGNQGDFTKDFFVKTKLYVHDKSTGKCYISANKMISESRSSNQNYFNIYIGGECSDSTNKHWYHVGPSNTPSTHENMGHIYMPMDDQVSGNSEMLKRIPHSNKTIVNIDAGHELGHLLGLVDAYAYVDEDGNIIDRMTNNEETCAVDYSESNPKSKYQNIMYQNSKSSLPISEMKANDIEMMLRAYTLTCGAPWITTYHQHYKTYIIKGKNIMISDSIKNKIDLYNDSVK